MAKVFLMCGSICSGKSTYAETLRKRHGAVLLSVDEIMLSLFGQDAGESHDMYVERAESLLYKKSLEITDRGINVILDMGFLTRAERDRAREFYGSRGIPYEFHYMDISDELRHERIQKRNADVLAGKADCYYVDDALEAKFAAIFEKPDRNEPNMIWKC